MIKQLSSCCNTDFHIASYEEQVNCTLCNLCSMPCTLKAIGPDGEPYYKHKVKAFLVGDKVLKTGEDFKFYGTVVARFNKLSGIPRFVLEDEHGTLIVCNQKHMEKL